MEKFCRFEDVQKTLSFQNEWQNGDVEIHVRRMKLLCISDESKNSRYAPYHITESQT